MSVGDTLPSQVKFRSMAVPPPGWTCITPAVDSVGGTITCTHPSMNANATAAFQITVRVLTTVTDSTVISNTATVSSSTTDSVSVNNSATSQTTARTAKLVISQAYGGGGLTSATYKNDFIEIFNAGKTTVDFSLTPYSVQYADATASFASSKTDITTGTIAPGQYFLIQESSGGATGATLPTPDVTGGTINLNANSGKVALVLGTTLLTGTCPGDDGIAPFNPTGSGIVDFLGYGFGTTTGNPNCFEGSARATTASATANGRSVIRTVSCTDTNDNSADFTYATSVTARNTSTTASPCP